MAKLIYEKSRPGRRAELLPQSGVTETEISKLIPAKFLRKRPPALPEVSELDTMRHFVRLSQLNHSIEKGSIRSALAQ